MNQLAASMVGAAHETRCFVDHRTRDELIRDHEGLALSIAHRRCHCKDEREDVEQVAFMALTKAADRFDASKDVAFTTFAWSTIEG